MAPRRSTPPELEQFYAIRRFNVIVIPPAIAFTSGGRRVAFAINTSGQFNLWTVAVGGGAARQLTSFEDRSVRHVAASPDGRTIVFTADRDGDEFHQLFALPAAGGWPEPLTDAASVQHFVGEGCWAPDGRRLAFAANARVPQDMDVWVRDMETGEVERVFGGDLYAFPASWSPDGRLLVAYDFRSNTDISIHLVDVAAGAARELTPHDDEVLYVPGPWANDGSGFYVRSNEGREFTGLAFFRLASGELEWVETPDGDVEEVAASPNGRVLAWLVNQDGWSRLRSRNLETGEDGPAPQLPSGTRSAGGSGLTVSDDGRAALVWHEPRRTGELYVVDLSTGRSRRLTDNMLGGLRRRDLVSPDLVSFASADGRRVPAWVYRPRRRGRVPAVLAIHGGPESQARPVYTPLYQYLLSRGIAVVEPNIRGSTGYGQTYQRLIRRDWGGAELDDLRQAREWLSAQDWVDDERVGVFGGSFGGFAVLSCITRLPDRWAAAVDIFGPSNLVTFVKAVPPTWLRFMAKWVGDPDADRQMLVERSPITYVDEIRTPLLVIQGAKDPRVVKAESDQLVERLRELGREVEYVVFDDEGHGFTRRRNELKAVGLAAEFLERTLAPA